MVWESSDSSIVREAPQRLTDVSSWHGHVPFAFWCVEALRPTTIVELGTHRGDSYCAFCQAVDRLRLPTACYAVDTWKGDSEAGLYGEEVLEELAAYHDARYAAFSRLVRSTFDDALAHFDDGAIDLLHVDGFHTYEAVRHDFEAWRPKLSRRGVVLFHDVNVREGDFGVARFWSEVSARHPHFTFLHGHGLGVLLVGEKAPAAARRLASAAPVEVAAARAFFADLGRAAAARGKLARDAGAVLEAIEAERDASRGERDEIRRERDGLQSERDALRTELDGLREARDGLTIELDRLRSERGLAVDEAVRARGAAADGAAALAAAEARLAALRAELGERARELAGARSGAAGLRLHLERLDARLRERTAALSLQSAEAAARTAEARGLAAALEARGIDLDTRTAEVERLRAELARLEEGMLALGERYRGAERTLADGALELDRRLGEIGGLRAEAATAGAELERARAELSRTRSEAATLSTRAAEALATSRRVEEGAARELARQDRAREELERAIAERDRTVELLRLELAEARTQAAEARRALSARLANIPASAARLPARLAHGARVLADLVRWAATGQLRAGLRRRQYARLIRRAWLLDRDFYLGQVGDDRLARRDPIEHYLVRGAAAGLDPNPFFDTSWYLERHPTARRYGKNPLVHFIRYGAIERLDPGPAFDLAWYVERHPDVARSGLNPLTHFVRFGHPEGRPGRPPPPIQRASPERLVLQPAVAGATASRVLLVDHRMLTPDQDSGSVRMFAIVRLLREAGHDVTFVSDCAPIAGPYEERLRALGVDVLYGFDATCERLASPGVGYRFALLSRPDQTYRYMPVVRAHAPDATLLYDTVDLHWVRNERAAELTGDPRAREEAERYRRIERVNTACADVTLAITPREAETLAAAVPGARIEVIPNIHEVREAIPPLERRSGLMFIGGFEHVPNVDGVLWFVEQVLPHVRARVPGTVLTVVGSKAPDEIRRLESDAVRVAGFVPDVDPIFDAARVFVSPLRYGAGMKGKIGQAMSAGLPVVTTSIGSEGMLLVDRENALITDDPRAFAGAVVELLQDGALWGRLSRAGRRHVDAHFSSEAIRSRLAALFPGPGAASGPGTGGAPARIAAARREP